MRISDWSSDVCSSDLHAFLSSFDDHEIRNDWVSDRDNWKLGLDAEDPDAPPPEVFMLKKQEAMQTWYEHMPVRRALLPRGGMVALNRELRDGDRKSGGEGQSGAVRVGLGGRRIMKKKKK